MAASRPDRHELALRDLALAYPETREDFPWEDHRAVKVRGKVFVILSHDGPELHVTVKLPWSAEGALQMFRFCEPTGYGLGRSGWVTASFGPKDRPPMDVLRSFIDESFKAVAPKKLVAALTERAVTSPRSAARRDRPGGAAPRGAAGRARGASRPARRRAPGSRPSRRRPARPGSRARRRGRRRGTSR